MNLKQKIRDYALQKSRNISYRPADYPGFETLKKLAVVFESGRQDESVKAFVKRMKDNGKSVRLMAYIPKKRKELQDVPEFDHFTKDDINWFGKPKSEEVKKFLNDGYQVFITLNERQESPIQFITVSAKADFIIGLTNGKIARLDLQVNLGEGHDYNKAFKEAEYYLRFINS